MADDIILGWDCYLFRALLRVASRRNMCCLNSHAGSACTGIGGGEGECPTTFGPVPDDNDTETCERRVQRRAAGVSLNSGVLCSTPGVLKVQYLCLPDGRYALFDMGRYFI